MKVTVLFFGIAHDVTGFAREVVEIGEGERLEDLRRIYERRFPPLGEMAGSLVAVVNQEMAVPDEPLKEGDEVAFLPPVSGGADRDFYFLTREEIPVRELAARLKAPADGAVVVFEGIVRNHSRGERTLYLEYEAYEAMAVRAMRAIGTALREEFPIDAVGMVHRLGRLEIGDTSVAIIVTSAHRQAAFEACREAINRLKQSVPIWKKEFFEDGSVWAEGSALAEEAKGRLGGDGGQKQEVEVPGEA
jgi:MoaE-MoaD fusion protein